jgi:hypothetical protein
MAAGTSLAGELGGTTTRSAGSETLKVATTSDTTPTASSSYPITTPNQPEQPTVVNTSPSAAAGALTNYTITFTTSETGALSSSAASQITIVFPAGTGLGSLSNSAVTDDTSSLQVGYCNASGTTATCTISATVPARNLIGQNSTASTIRFPTAARP